MALPKRESLTATSSFDCFDPPIASLIRRKARSLIGKSGLTKSDVPDIEQQLAWCVHRAMAKYDQERSRPQGWAGTVIDRCIATLLEHLRAGVRDWRLNGTSLDAPQIDVDGRRADLGQSVRDDRVHAHRGVSPRSAEEFAVLAMDLATVLDSLPAELREICERLKSQPLAHVAKDLGMSRTALYERVHGICELFEAAGLREYL